MTPPPQELLPVLTPLLAHPSQRLRGAVLRVLTCYEQPALQPVVSTQENQAPQQQQQQQQSTLK